MKENHNSRRDAIQNLGSIGAGLLMFSLAACNQPDKQTEVAEIKPPLPFLIPTQQPLETGAAGFGLTYYHERQQALLDKYALS